jgi:hypothetical protein
VVEGRIIRAAWRPQLVGNDLELQDKRGEGFDIGATPKVSRHPCFARCKPDPHIFGDSAGTAGNIGSEAVAKDACAVDKPVAFASLAFRISNYPTKLIDMFDTWCERYPHDDGSGPLRATPSPSVTVVGGFPADGAIGLEFGLEAAEMAIADVQLGRHPALFAKADWTLSILPVGRVGTAGELAEDPDGCRSRAQGFQASLDCCNDPPFGAGSLRIPVSLHDH